MNLVPWFGKSLCQRHLTLSQLKLHICGVSKTFGELYQQTNKTEDTNKWTLLAFEIIAILHNTRLATFIKLLEAVSKGFFGEEKNYLPIPGFEPQIVRTEAYSLYRVQHSGFRGTRNGSLTILPLDTVLICSLHLQPSQFVVWKSLLTLRLPN
jgi:hypothetical protein